MLAEGVCRIYRTRDDYDITRKQRKAFRRKIYGNGIGNFLTILIGKENFRLPLHLARWLFRHLFLILWMFL